MWSAVSGQACEREEISFATCDLTPESSSRVESSYESAWLAGYEELCAIMKLIYITGLCVATWTSFPTAAIVCLLASVD